MTAAGVTLAAVMHWGDHELVRGLLAPLALLWATPTAAEQTSVAEQPTAPLPGYPASPRLDLVETLFGQKVADPYRWLEKDPQTDPMVADWVARENALPGYQGWAKGIRLGFTSDYPFGMQDKKTQSYLDAGFNSKYVNIIKLKRDVKLFFFVSKLKLNKFRTKLRNEMKINQQSYASEKESYLLQIGEIETNLRLKTCNEEALIRKTKQQSQVCTLAPRFTSICLSKFYIYCIVFI